MQPCSVCRRPPLRAKVDAELVDGATNREVFERTGVSRSSVQRHRAHLAGVLRSVIATDAATVAAQTLARLRSRGRLLRAMAEDAYDEGDIRAATGAVRADVELLAMYAKLTGAFERGTDPAATERMTSAELVRALLEDPEVRAQARAVLEEDGK